MDGSQEHHVSTSTNNVIPSPFLGKAVATSIVTYDAFKTMAGLVNLGIGPFKVFNFTPANMHNQTYFGLPTEYSLRVCYAHHENMTWEIMEPIAGPSIIADYLATKGDGVQRITFDCSHSPVEARIAEFERRGCRLVQSGVWQGKTGTCQINFFDTESSIGTCFGTCHFSPDWEEPAAVENFPAMPKA